MSACFREKLKSFPTYLSSKNKKIRDRVDARVQLVWRLRVKVSCHSPFLNPHSTILILQSSFYNPHSTIPILQSPFYNPHSTIPILQSPFYDPHSTIPILQSPFYNSHSTILILLFLLLVTSDKLQQKTLGNATFQACGEYAIV